MFLRFLGMIRAAGVPVSMREHLTLLEALRADVVTVDAEGFYHLARAAMVKDERHVDRFDRAFAACFGGLDDVTLDAVLDAVDLPAAWLEALAEKTLSPEERAQLAGSSGFDTLMETLRARLREQRGRHEGGSKWIGTAGTSPFGAQGDNPEGVRIGQDASRHRRAVKVWDRRTFRDLDDTRTLDTRAIRLALRRLRAWARDGGPEELDLDGTIRSTARQGWLDVRTRPERRLSAKVLLFLDVGGSMDDHVRVVEELFSAARSAFRTLRPYYFHNCLYEGVWTENRRRHDAVTPTDDLLRTCGPDHRAIFVGDAAMSPYEIAYPGGASEHWNAETGQVWLERARGRWPSNLWINPVPRVHWDRTRSTGMIREIFDDRMVPLTLEGLNAGMRMLTR